MLCYRVWDCSIVWLLSVTLSSHHSLQLCSCNVTEVPRCMVCVCQTWLTKYPASGFTSIIPDAVPWEHVFPIPRSQLPLEQDKHLRVGASVGLPSPFFVSNKMHFGEMYKAKESSFSSILLFLTVSGLSHFSVSLLLYAHPEGSS